MDIVVDDVADDVSAAIAELRGDPAPEPKAEPAPEKVETPAPEAKAAEPVKDERTDAERARDEQGRFVAKDKTEQKEAPKPEAKAAPEVKPTETEKPVAQPEQKPPALGGPPAGWSVKAKAQWDRISPLVREEILKTSQADPVIGNLKPFAERARQAGQTLEQALSSYTGLEDLIRRDAPGGFLHVAANLGMTQHEAGSMFLSLAQRLGVVPQTTQQNVPGHQPVAETTATPEQQALEQMLSRYLQPIAERVTQLDTTFRSQSQAQEAARLNTAQATVEQFKADPAHRYYDNVEADIVRLLNSGVVQRSGDFAKDLSAAYDMACRMNPEVYDALTQERVTSLQEEREARDKAAADKARNASRSITGSPSPGAAQRKQNERKPGASYDDDLYADVRAAVGQVAARA